MGEGDQSICRTWTANEDHTLNHHLLSSHINLWMFFPSFCDFISQFFPCFAMMHHGTGDCCRQEPHPIEPMEPPSSACEAPKGPQIWFMFHIEHLMEYINNCDPYLKEEQHLLWPICFFQTVKLVNGRCWGVFCFVEVVTKKQWGMFR